MTRLNSIIAAKQAIRQHESLARANSAGDDCDRIVARIWSDLLTAVKAKDFRRVADLWRASHARITSELYVSFKGLAVWGYDSAADVVRQTLPKSYAAALPQVTREAAGDESAVPWKMFLQFLFPPPSKQFIDDVVLGSQEGIHWTDRIATLSRLASPETIAAVVSQAYAGGASPPEIAKKLLPVLDNVRSSARRVARTEGLRIAHRAQMACHEQLGDLIAGYQVNSAFGPTARHSHSLRSGTIYWKNPKPGQLGFDVMPHPPVDRGAPHDDGPPGVKPWCRCWLAPVLRQPSDFSESQRTVFETQAKEVIPDPLTYSDWFAGASPQWREQAVGVRRYRTLASEIENPRWEYFVDEQGKLLTVDQLKDETPQERTHRVLKVQRLLSEHARDRKQVAAFGFLEPPQLPKNAVTLPDGEVVQFIKASGDRLRVLVEVDVGKLDAAWAQDVNFHIPTGGGGAEIAGRRANFAAFLAKRVAVEAPGVHLDKYGNVYFRDGRHRFSVLRDRGARRVVIAVDRGQAKKFRERFS